MIAAWMMAATAHAFCGTYVGDGSETLLNQGSQIAITRQDGKTTITMANDYVGNLDAFAMLVPVPVVLQEEDVRVVSADLVNRLDSYSAPRLVRYTCEDFMGFDMMSSASACGDKDAMLSVQSADSADTALNVTVENSFEVGIYEIVILSAEDAGDLLTWLDREGYAADPAAEEMLGDYIEQGTYFFAAKVSLDDLGASKWLEPLQFSYEASTLALPIRLGTLNSPGEQDLVIYVVNEAEFGSAGISNYPQISVESECMWEPASGGETVGDHYNSAFDAAWEEGAEGGAAWSREYSWSPAKCDPCPDGGALTDQDVAALGFSGIAASAHFTRLRVRYTPEAAAEDLMLYLSHDSSTEQVRFIEYHEPLEDMFPICGEGWVPADEAGSCWDEDGEATARTRQPIGRALAAFAALAAGVAMRRRQSASGQSRQDSGPAV